MKEENNLNFIILISSLIASIFFISILMVPKIKIETVETLIEHLERSGF